MVKSTLLLSLATLGCVSADPMDVVVHEPIEMLRVWTEEMLANAQPYPIPVLSEEQFSQMLKRSARTIKFFTAASSPGSIEGTVSADIKAENPTIGTAAISDPSRAPFNSVGKIFFSQGGGSYVCSGSQIAPGILLTAGHCLHDGSSKWSSNVIWHPSYPAAGKSYTASGFACFEGWTQGDGEGFDFDFCMARLSGDPVGDGFGTSGFSYNQGINGTWQSVGYPAAAPYSGEQMYRAAGSLKTGSIGAYSKVEMSPNDMTGGCSGGPWWKDGTANGVNSFRYVNSPNTMYSPYFGDGPMVLFNQVKNTKKIL